MSETTTCASCHTNIDKLSRTYIQVVLAGNQHLQTFAWYARLPLDFCSAPCLVAYFKELR